VPTFLFGILQHLQPHVRWFYALCAHGQGHVIFVRCSVGNGEEDVVGGSYVGLRFRGLGLGWSWDLDGI